MSRVVFFDSDPIWVNALDLAPFVALETRLRVWQVGPSVVDGCYELTHPTLVTVTLPLTDASVPTTSVLRELQRLEWRPVRELVLHEADTAAMYDSRDAHSKKYYFQCLLCLGQILKVVSPVHSGQPSSYYKLLLLGKAVEAGKGHQFYCGILRDMDAADEDDIARLPLPAPPTVAALADDSDSDFALGGGEKDAIDPVPKTEGSCEACSWTRFRSWCSFWFCQAEGVSSG